MVCVCLWVGGYTSVMAHVWGQKTTSRSQFSLSILWGLGMKGRLLVLVAHAFLGGARLPAFTLTFEHTETKLKSCFSILLHV